MLSSIRSYILSHWMLSVFLLFCLLSGAGILISSDILPVSYTVGNRELPVYCVDTPEKKIALSFDAACVNGE